MSDMPINTNTLVLAAVAENAIGVPLQRGLPIALFASTLRPMTGLIFALLLGKSFATATPSGFSIAIPPAGTGGTGMAGPAITNIAPPLGNVGTPVTISGSGFGPAGGAATVLFNTSPATNVPATNVQVVSPSTITANVPDMNLEDYTEVGVTVGVGGITTPPASFTFVPD
jgi:IPT/TIG domain